ncbi:MAG TPA: hypothetical protein C5S37_14280 [Methanophagales archaeon]|nr:hypothetical protein [Methanophagales archaeon]
MGKSMKEYLLDTNILIYHFADTINVISLSNEIGDLTVDIRRESKIKLPDAVIAATALNNDLILVTRNDKDFKDVKELEVYNPFSGEI